jgi:adenylyltransferase/sulfurtransferase
MLTTSNASAIIEPYNIVVDCTDNFETRYLINDICVKQGKVLIYGAVYQYEGQVATLNVKTTSKVEFSANYRDIFPNANAIAIPNCHDGGVIPSLAGVIGCIQANEVLKYLIGSTELLINQLLILDGLTMRTTSIKVKTKGYHTLEKNHSTAFSSPSITKEEYLSNSENYLLVDVRSIDERFAFHIGGFHMPLEQILTGGWKPTNKKPILLYCATGKRSATAVNKLLNDGITAVYSLENGIQNW